jgi:hypothetical protein
MRDVSQKISQARGEKGEPLLTIAARAVGLRKAFRVLTFMAAWDRARVAMRRQTLTLDEYAQWWKVSPATSYREQALFRECFPQESTPDRLLDVAAVQWDESHGVAALGRVLFPA